MNGYVCPKCQNQEYETDKIHVTEGGLAKMFDVQNKSFYAISCTKCGYTEFFKTDTSTLENIIDLLFGR